MGQTQSTSSMIDSVIVRVPEISTRSLVLYFINRALRYWNGIAAFLYQYRTASAPLSFGPNIMTLALPADLDTGGEIYLYTTGTNPYPVRRKALDEYGIAGVYSGSKVSPNFPDHWVIVGANILIYPGISAGVTLNCIYQKITAPLTDSVSSFSLVPDNFDDLIVDFAEAEIKRVYRVVGWEPLMARMMDQSKMLTDAYRIGTSASGGTTDQLREGQDSAVLGKK